jgi:hypothetical protein
MKKGTNPHEIMKERLRGYYSTYGTWVRVAVALGATTANEVGSVATLCHRVVNQGGDSKKVRRMLGLPLSKTYPRHRRAAEFGSAEEAERFDQLMAGRKLIDLVREWMALQEAKRAEP